MNDFFILLTWHGFGSNASATAELHRKGNQEAVYTVTRGGDNSDKRVLAALVNGYGANRLPDVLPLTVNNLVERAYRVRA